MFVKLLNCGSNCTYIGNSCDGYIKKNQGFLSGVQSPKSIIRCLEHVKNINYEEIYNGRTNVQKAAQLLLCKCFQDN